MNAPSELSEIAVSPDPPGTKGTRLQGFWLLIARFVWVGIVVFTLGVFIVSLPAYFAQLQTVCSGVTCVYRYGQLTPSTAHALQNLGLSSGLYRASIFALAVASAFVYFGVASVLFWRRSADWMVMLVSLFLVTFGTNFLALGLAAANPQSPWEVPLNIVTGLGYVSLVFLLYLFPDGRFVPRWTRPLAVFVVASNIFLDASRGGISTLPAWMLSVIYLINGGSGVIAQIYRYRRVSSTEQRQQTKWVVLGLAATLLVILGRIVPFLIFPSLSTSSSPYVLLSTYVYPLGLLLLPLTLGIAVLRYRLWDIDSLINRTLVYGSLTALLALVYFGLIFGLQALFKAITGEVGASPVVIVISTLAIAALFQPLRHQIQTLIDRRFYRYKYDAARTLAAFSATLQNDVDLSQLSAQLVALVEETMQPASVSLWLRAPSQETRPGPNQPSQMNGVPEKAEAWGGTI
jgi:hypothetical protein